MHSGAGFDSEQGVGQQDAVDIIQGFGGHPLWAPDEHYI
jgi:hypothetical protein